MAIFLLGSCRRPELPAKQFSYLESTYTGVHFVNELTPTREMNIFNYLYFYNGGGVAVGDINNDGLSDLYFTSNMGANRLYLNKGDLHFEDITEKAGVRGAKFWSTGTSMVDVNADGFLDLYVCNSGITDPFNRANELFINNGDLTFSEQARHYGLDDTDNSTHASFFDYDRDGDLDCYLLNNAFKAGTTTTIGNIRQLRGNNGGDRLLRNDQGKFIDVTLAAGIYSSDYAYGLGIGVNDINNDGWPDLYISNDFLERDYLYLNNQDGTFSERLTHVMTHTSEFSMGSAVVDINDDGWNDVLTVDMLPSTHQRLKTTIMHPSYTTYAKRVESGYYHQVMRNTLHLNNGNESFSEIGSMLGMQATDWSWSPLVADFDNDGFKDVYIANGIYKDITDLDFVDFVAADQQRAHQVQNQTAGFLELIALLPSVELPNFMYQGQQTDDFTLNDVTTQWGLDRKSFSNGSAYADLDNDGDLDLVVNNVNQQAFIVRNNSESDVNRSIKISFSGPSFNPFGIGTKVELKLKSGRVIFGDNYPNKGFQSAMEPTLTMGLGSDTVDSLVVTWPDGKQQLIKSPEAGSGLTLDYKDANNPLIKKTTNKTYLLPSAVELPYRHQENEYIDFDYDRMLLHMHSTQGPAVAVADLNGDGRDDLYLGAAFGSSGQLLLHTSKGRFSNHTTSAFEGDHSYEDVDAVFVDVDNDGDLDLIVASGGCERGRHLSFQDRIYLNQGTTREPDFVRSFTQLPSGEQSSSRIAVADFDNDGDDDLFIGTRLNPANYGVPVTSRLLENVAGTFVDVTAEKIPQLQSLGMVTDAAWLDHNGDGRLDLVVLGDWMPLTLFENRGVGFQKRQTAGFEHTSGWWNAIEAVDLNGDGLQDLVAGNLGVNSPLKATVEQPLQLFIADFDANGTLDQVVANYDEQGRLVPYAEKSLLMEQLPHLKKRFLKASEYAVQSMESIFGASLDHAIHLKAEAFESMVFYNRGSGFEKKKLPQQAQESPVFAIHAIADKSGNPGLLLGGNFSSVQPEIGPYQASYGTLLQAVDEDLEVIPNSYSGLKVKGEVRHIRTLHLAGKELVVFVKNNEKPEFYEYKL